MASYVKSTNFTAKDSLPTGDSARIVKGTEIDTEFNAIASAISSKADSNSPIFTGTPAAPTAVLGTNTTQIATTAFATAAATAAFPVGGIIMWSGSIAAIPSGWSLCNGANGTPDLRDRFVIGAGTLYAVNATGGNKDAVVVSHTHTATSTVTDPGHTHQIGNGEGVGRSNSGKDLMGFFFNSPQYITTNATGISVATTNSTTGVSGTNANLPPYLALAYIMRTA